MLKTAIAVPWRPPAQQQGVAGGRRACRQPGGCRAEASGRRGPAQGELALHDGHLEARITCLVMVFLPLTMLLLTHASACHMVA